MNKQVFIRLPIVIAIILGCSWFVARRAMQKRIESVQILGRDATNGKFTFERLGYTLLPRPRITGTNIHFEPTNRARLNIETVSLSDSLFDQVEAAGGGYTKVLISAPKITLERIDPATNDWQEALSRGAMLLTSIARSPLCSRLHRFQVQESTSTSDPSSIAFTAVAGEGTCINSLFMSDLKMNAMRGTKTAGAITASKIQASEFGVSFNNLTWTSDDGTVTLDGTMGTTPENFALQISGQPSERSVRAFFANFVSPYVTELFSAVAGASIRFEGRLSKNTFLARTTIEEIKAVSTTGSWHFSGSGIFQDKRSNITFRGDSMDLGVLFPNLVQSYPVLRDIKLRGNATTRGTIVTNPTGPNWNSYLQADFGAQAIKGCVKEKETCIPFLDVDSLPLAITLTKDALGISHTKTRAKLFNSPAYIMEMNASITENSLNLTKLQASLLGGTASIESAPDSIERYLLLADISIREILSFLAEPFEKIHANRAELRIPLPLSLLAGEKPALSFSLRGGKISGLDLQRIVSFQACPASISKESPTYVPETPFELFSGILASSPWDQSMQLEEVQIYDRLGIFTGWLSQTPDGRWTGSGTFVPNPKGETFLEALCKRSTSDQRIEWKIEA